MNTSLSSALPRLECTRAQSKVGSDPIQTCDALVLDAKLRQSLAAVRSLGHRGIHVVAEELAEYGSHVPAFSSRWCRQGYIAPSYEQSADSYLTHLEKMIAYTNARVLITSSDATIAVIRQHRERLERLVRIGLAKEPALGIATNKEQTLGIAKQLGIEIPRGVTIKSISDVPEALKEIRLPAVVKPVESWPWGHQLQARLVSSLVTTPYEAHRAVKELTSHGGSILFQQFLSGEREAVSLFFANGKIHARFAQWAKRTDPPLGGVSVYRRSIPIPEDIGDQSERLIHEIELEGYSEVEFRRDSAGRPYLMEINPRLSASIEVAIRSGVDFPYLIYQWSAGEHINTVEGYRAGYWMRYLEGDILATAQSFAQCGRPGVTPPGKATLDFLTSFFTPSGYDYLDWRDPLPACIATIDLGDRALHRLRRRFTDLGKRK